MDSGKKGTLYATVETINISQSIVESFFEDIFTAYDFRLLAIHPFRIAYYVENVLKLSSKLNTSVNQTTAASVWRWSLMNNLDYLNFCIKPTLSYTNTFGAGIKGLCQL